MNLFYIHSTMNIMTQFIVDIILCTHLCGRSFIYQQSAMDILLWNSSAYTVLWKWRRIHMWHSGMHILLWASSAYIVLWASRRIHLWHSSMNILLCTQLYEHISMHWTYFYAHSSMNQNTSTNWTSFMYVVVWTLFYTLRHSSMNYDIVL